MEVAAGGGSGRGPDLRGPDAVGDEVHHALLGLEGPRHAAEGGGLGEDARRKALALLYADFDTAVLPAALRIVRTVRLGVGR